MIDHFALQVRDLKASQHFYDAALIPLGYKNLMEDPTKNAQGSLVFGWGDSHQTDFWISEGVGNEPRLHIAFRAEKREQVDAFYRAAIAAGGRDNGKPGLRTEYHANYYGAFVLDPDRWATVDGNWTNWEPIKFEPGAIWSIPRQGGFFCQTTFDSSFDEGIQEKTYELPFTVLSSPSDANAFEEGSYRISVEGSKVDLVAEKITQPAPGVR